VNAVQPTTDLDSGQKLLITHTVATATDKQPAHY